jgi:preprotein translocase subunit SecE
MLQRQGQLGDDGEPATRKRTAPAAPRPTEQRTTAPQFLREVRGELRKVAWPTRAEVVNYSIIVLVAIIILTAYVAFLDYGFGDVLLRLFSR